MPRMRWINVLLLGTIVLLAPGYLLRAANTITVKTLADMNLLSAPDPMADVLAVIPSGTLLTALGRDPLAYWVQVNYKGQTGWLFESFLARSAAFDPLPVVGGSPSNPQLEPEIGPVRAAASIDMNVRAGPGLEYAIIGHLPQGQAIVLDGKSGAWYRFRFNNQREGWLWAALVLTNGDQANLPDVQP